MLLFKNFHVIDPVNQRSELLDVLLDDHGIIKHISPNIEESDHQVIWGGGRVLTSGFCDFHTNFGEPGFEYRETIKTGSEAALAGGFTTVCLYPNTKPIIDSLQVLEYLKAKIEQAPIEIEIFASLTKECGSEIMSPLKSLFESGVKAFTNGDQPLQNSFLMKNIFDYASMFRYLIISQPLDKVLSNNGVLTEGYQAQRLGLTTQSKAAEEIFIHRDASLLGSTGGKLHFLNISTQEGINALRYHKDRGLDISSSVSPFYFSLSDDLLDEYNTNYKLSPPLRSNLDVESVRVAIQNGTIDFIASSHTPHSEIEKTTDFLSAPVGAISLETTFSLSYMNLVKTNYISLEKLIELLVVRPRLRLGIPIPTMVEGELADFVVIDLFETKTLTSELLKSKSKNTPYFGKKILSGIDMVFTKNKLHTFHEKTSSDYTIHS